MTHEWRHLKMLKRAGRGHDPERPIVQTAPGECAVLCRACPQPGKNMAPGWENEPPERRSGTLEQSSGYGLTDILDFCMLYSWLSTPISA